MSAPANPLMAIAFNARVVFGMSIASTSVARFAHFAGNPRLVDKEYPFADPRTDRWEHSADEMPLGRGVESLLGAAQIRALAEGRAGSGIPGLYAPLAEILREVGRPGFYQTLAAQMSKLLGCDRYLVMRYSQFAKPAFLVNNFMPVAVENFYLNDLYRLDPLHGMVRRRG